ncbi:hypothetical protein BKA69DRAFT_1056192 [Paraphysoderma sedebokerense]|nr:hypothetical protein BKA69DRAFT_1056192 [Paraphysoderma sedebokerense]
MWICADNCAFNFLGCQFQSLTCSLTSHLLGAMFPWFIFIVFLPILHPICSATPVSTSESTTESFEVPSPNDGNQGPHTAACSKTLDSVPNLKQSLVSCTDDGRPNLDILRDFHFLGWHGTIVKHIDSLHNEIKVFDPTKPDENLDAKSVNTLKHGQGFYTTDSINVARQYQGNAYISCLEKKGFLDGSAEFDGTTKSMVRKEDPECAPAMCGIFMSRSFWKSVPKVFDRGSSGAKAVKAHPDPVKPMADENVPENAGEKTIDIQPLIFSELGPAMQTVVPPMHVGNVMALCAYDSVGREYLNRHWYYDMPKKPIDLNREKVGTIGQYFGSNFESMVGLNYWKRLRIQSKRKNGSRDNRSKDGWEVEVIGGR